MASEVSYLKKINCESVVQQVIRCLTEAMVNKELRPGDKLPTELELAESMGIGRNSVREALKILTYLGVLEIHRPEGTFVGEGFTRSMINPMIYGIILEGADSYTNLMDLRGIVESGVVYQAMKKYNEEDVQQLKKALDHLKEEIQKGTDNVQGVFESDNQFHEMISHMGHNPLVDKINQVVRELTYAIRLKSVEEVVKKGKGQEFYKEHEKIYVMVKEKNSSHIQETIRATYYEVMNI